MRESVKKKIDEAYEHIEAYLNDDCCEILHKMCDRCEKYLGRIEHNYEECRDEPCFICYLSYKYLDWSESFKEFPDEMGKW